MERELRVSKGNPIGESAYRSEKRTTQRKKENEGECSAEHAVRRKKFHRNFFEKRKKEEGASKSVPRRGPRS